MLTTSNLHRIRGDIMPDLVNKRLHSKKLNLSTKMKLITLPINIAIFAALIISLPKISIINENSPLIMLSCFIIVVTGCPIIYLSVNGIGDLIDTKNDDSIVHYSPTSLSILRSFIPQTNIETLYYLMINRLLQYDPNIEITNSDMTFPENNFDIISIKLEAKSESHHTNIIFSARLTKTTLPTTYQTINFKINN